MDVKLGRSGSFQWPDMDADIGGMHGLGGDDYFVGPRVSCPTPILRQGLCVSPQLGQSFMLTPEWRA